MPSADDGPDQPSSKRSRWAAEAAAALLPAALPPMPPMPPMPAMPHACAGGMFALPPPSTPSCSLAPSVFGGAATTGGGSSLQLCAACQPGAPSLAAIWAGTAVAPSAPPLAATPLQTLQLQPPRDASRVPPLPNAVAAAIANLAERQERAGADDGDGVDAPRGEPPDPVADKATERENEFKRWKVHASEGALAAASERARCNGARAMRTCLFSARELAQALPPRAHIRTAHPCVARPAQNALVECARPILNRAYEAKLISRDEYKAILRKVADKVVSGYRAQHTRAPARCAISDTQAAAIQKLVDDYVEYTRKQWN